MQYKSKPGIDWREIRERYSNGQSANSLAQEFDVSRQAIMKRAKKENWPTVQTVTINPGNWMQTVTEFHELEGKQQYTPEKIAKALELIAVGANHAVASAAIGVGRTTWHRWKDECAALQAAIEEAQAHHAHKALLSIDRAAETDWKAAERILASNPLTKGEYSKESTGGVSITFNINRASAEEIDAAHMIDVTPE